MSLSVDSLNMLYNSKAASNSTDKLEGTLNKDLSNSSEDELMKVCKDFESYFTEQMFKAMQKMVPDSSGDMSASSKQLQDYYKEQMVQNFAESSAQGEGLGMAQALYEQMKNNYGIK